MLESAVFQSFCVLQRALLPIQIAWAPRPAAEILLHALGDVRHHCASAASFLVDFEGDRTWAPGEAYPLLTEVDRMVAREAFFAVLGLEQLLVTSLAKGLPGTLEIDAALVAIDRLFRSLAPFTTAADRSLRPAGSRTPRPVFGHSTRSPTSFRAPADGPPSAKPHTP